jgi:hypothetical protein
MPEAAGGLPEVVRRLVAERIDSIAQLELLLLLHGSAPAEWDAKGIAAELRLDPTWAAEELAKLCRRGLCAETAEDAGRYRFAPASPELANAVALLDASYADRRVAIVALIYGKPVEPIREFAEAFRIRKEESDG